MKRIISILTILATIIALAACTPIQNPISENTESVIQDTEKITEINLGETITVGEFGFRIDSISWEDTIHLRGKKYGPGPDEVIAVIEVTIFNNARKEINQFYFPDFYFNYDNGYDGRPIRGSWQYGTSTYFDQTIPAQSSSSFRFCEDISELQATDKTVTTMLEISFQDENFVYYINKIG